MKRREFLGSMVLPAGFVAAGGWSGRAPGAVLAPAAPAAALELAASRLGPAEAAADEDFWSVAGAGFTLDRTLVNLNNGGVSPAPLVVQDAMKRHLDYCNSVPPPVALWRSLAPQREVVRTRLARAWGTDPEELAITRNSSESLQICQLGFDLAEGDEVLTTTQDYPRMLTTFRQRERREKIVLKTFPLPVPIEDPAEIVRLFESNITARTRLILMCHMINITGQILPVRQVVAMARAKGIPVIVDGAHALAHLDFRIPDLDCEYYGVSLHKWLFAPHGTGLLYVRRDKVKSLWPMMAAPAEMEDNIRKFEEIGTHPIANLLAIGEALTYHQAVGGARKEARLRYLRDWWATRLLKHPSGRVKLHTSLKPEFSCGIGTVQVDGLDSVKLADHLWDRHRILTTAIRHEEFQGIRVTPSVYTTLDELDRFCGAVEGAIAGGLPA